MHGPPAGPIVPARQRQSASELLSWQVKCACALTSPATQSTRAHIYFREKSLWRIRPNKWAEWTKSICTQTIGRKHRWAGQTVRNFSIYILISKNTLWRVKMWWVVGKFFDVTKMRVNLFHFCLKWVKIDIRFDTHENDFCFTHLQISPTCRFRFHPLLFPVSPTCRFHLLIEFINFQISPSFTWQFWAHIHLWARPDFCPNPSYPLLQISPTCRFHQLSDFTQFHFCQISPTCRFHQLAGFTQFHLTILSPHSLVGSARFLPKSIVPKLADFTNFWDQISPSFTFVRFHQLADFINFQMSPSHHFQISPTCRFHLLVVTTCTCLVLWLWWLALSVFTYTSFWCTIFFHPLYHRNQFSLTMLCALVSPTGRYNLLQ